MTSVGRGSGPKPMSRSSSSDTAVAATINGPSAHYDLGAGGHGVTTDCHDASEAAGGLASNPHCFTGPVLAGVSTGIQWRF